MAPLSTEDIVLLVRKKFEHVLSGAVYIMLVRPEEENGVKLVGFCALRLRCATLRTSGNRPVHAERRRKALKSKHERAP